MGGRQIEVVGGTNGLRALHIRCSTPGCVSTPADWILSVKSDTVREIDILSRDQQRYLSDTALSTDYWDPHCSAANTLGSPQGRGSSEGDAVKRLSERAQ